MQSFNHIACCCSCLKASSILAKRSGCMVCTSASTICNERHYFWGDQVFLHCVGTPARNSAGSQGHFNEPSSRPSVFASESGINTQNFNFWAEKTPPATDARGIGGSQTLSTTAQHGATAWKRPSWGNNFQTIVFAAITTPCPDNSCIKLLTTRLTQNGRRSRNHHH